MLGFLEQQPLYNAANFNWSIGPYYAWPYNSTVSVTIINTFICPSDGLSPIPTQNGIWTGETNNYLASFGTSTNYGNGGDTTGPFTMGGPAYGVQAITDGTSNTIAFGEALVGDNTIEQVKWRDGPTLAAGSATCNGGSWCGLYDISIVYNLVIQDLNTCMQGFMTQQGSGAGAYNQKGFRWSESDGGFGTFTVVVPPSSTQWPFGWCGLRGGKPNSNASDGQYQNANSNHPGGANFLFCDGSVHFLKSSISIKSYWALGTRNGSEVISADAY
jgi:prepilin-type processing-associated H-X9-DG protein